MYQGVGGGNGKKRLVDSSNIRQSSPLAGQFLYVGVTGTTTTTTTPMVSDFRTKDSTFSVKMGSEARLHFSAAQQPTGWCVLMCRKDAGSTSILSLSYRCFLGEKPDGNTYQHFLTSFEGEKRGQGPKSGRTKGDQWVRRALTPHTISLHFHLPLPQRFTSK